MSKSNEHQLHKESLSHTKGFLLSPSLHPSVSIPAERVAVMKHENDEKKTAKRKVEKINKHKNRNFGKSEHRKNREIEKSCKPKKTSYITSWKVGLV